MIFGLYAIEGAITTEEFVENGIVDASGVGVNL